MSGSPDYADNPFLPKPQTGFIPAPDPGGFLSGVREGDPFPQGILLSPGEQAALAGAPKLTPSTEITVRAKPVDQVGGLADHMFETFDDGHDRYIFRGGPSGPFLHAQVDPMEQSPDYGADSRVLYRQVLPGQTATQAVAPARAEAARINNSGAYYAGIGSNSNSVIGDFTSRQYGKRVGDSRTVGYKKGFSPPLAPFDPFWP
ncbi:MAG: hypothetical protein JSR98_00495 [Proteobacteria bacterium]|nr:hypothetical protein [Pseudomonadota bacterium]